jgi:hypothetical protein
VDVLWQVDGKTRTRSDRNRGAQVLVPRKAGPSKIKNKPNLLGVHIAEALGNAEFGLDVKRVPKRQNAPRNRSADQVRIAKAPLPSGLEVYEYVILMCEKLRSAEYRDRAISRYYGANATKENLADSWISIK